MLLMERKKEGRGLRRQEENVAWLVQERDDAVLALGCEAWPDQF